MPDFKLAVTSSSLYLEWEENEVFYLFGLGAVFQVLLISEKLNTLDYGSIRASICSLITQAHPYLSMLQPKV